MVLFASEMTEFEACGVINPLKLAAIDEEILRAARLRRWLKRSKLSIHEAIMAALQR